VEGNATPVTLKISSGTEQPIHLTESAAEEARTKKALLAKDKALLNDAGYHELKMVKGSGLPSLTKLKKERKRQNAEIPIEPIRTAVKGDGCRRKIKHILEYLLEMKDFQDMFEGARRAHNKIAVCGGWASNIKEDWYIHKPDHQYTACLYNGKEGHEELVACMKDVFQEMKDLERRHTHWTGFQQLSFQN